MIDVSVVICALNEERRIGRQLAALDAQIDAPPFEVIVVDNGSTDGTVAVVQEWIRSSPHAAVGMRVVDASNTPGIPAARNAGARAAEGRVLAYCDADDEVQPGWVAAIAHGMQGTTIAGGRLIAFASDGTCRGDLYGGLVATSYLPHIGCANAAVDRLTFLEVGGFDESLPRYGFEDVDLSWRIQEAGHPIVYLPDAVVHFSLSGSRASVRKRFELGKGRVLMARRFPRYDATEYTVLSTVRDAGRAGGRLLRTLVTQRRLDNRLASQAVAAAGRVAGAIVYRKGTTPPRQLLVNRSELL
ncbi:glycosyltransferase family 2 protein [Brachybacterium paraconglomeratum]|uniref:glycosyltransferase family 2 protein n=1 Tax=Brachybacterium paraconglomeratum TaxID=173362 RepID=UPI003FD5D1ED